MLKAKRIVSGLVVLLVGGVGVGGCAAHPETSGQLLDRLTSAEEITAVGPREMAMSDIAKDAAKSNQPNICLRAVDGIRSQTGLRSQTAQACAATFDNLGERPVADSLVNRIDNPALRNKLRFEYAESAAPQHTTQY